MCGIFGFITSKPAVVNYDFLVRLAEKSSIRGTDATGISYFDETDKKYYIEKNNVGAGDFYNEIMKGRKKDITKTRICIGHTRNWTTGTPEDNNNNHPIFSKDFIMVHNGMCVRTPKVDAYKYIGTVDSELILAQIQINGIKTGLENSDGSAGIALINRRPKKKEVLLYRHGRPLWLAYDPDQPTIWFASTDEILDRSLNIKVLAGFFRESSYYMKELPEDQLWRLTFDKDGKPMVEYVEPIKLGEKFSYVEYMTKNKTGSPLFGKRRNEEDVDLQDGGIRINDKRRVTGNYKAVGGDAEWKLIFNIERNEKAKYPIFDWDWDAGAKVLYHKYMRVVRGYDYHNMREIVASPEYAVEHGWAECIPTVYAGNSVKNISREGRDSKEIAQLRDERSCVLCIAAGKDTCVKCKDKSHWRELK